MRLIRTNPGNTIYTWMTQQLTYSDNALNVVALNRAFEEFVEAEKKSGELIRGKNNIYLLMCVLRHQSQNEHLIQIGL